MVNNIYLRQAFQILTKKYSAKRYMIWELGLAHKYNYIFLPSLEKSLEFLLIA